MRFLLPIQVVLNILILTFFPTNGIPFSTQVHIGLIPPNKISISWVTNASYSDPPIVYLASTNPIFQNITVNSTQIASYTQPNLDINRYYHHAITPSLTALKQYWYQPGPNASIYTFTARNQSQSTTNGTKPFSFLSYGDLGVTNAQNTVSLIQQLIAPTNAIDFILHLGDISYADDRDLVSDNPAYTQIYDQFGTLLEPIWSTIPYMTAPGNHEQTCHMWSDYHCHSSLENFTVYREYFRMPLSAQNESGGGVMNMWWSINYKNIHILSISTETDYPGSPDQGDYHNDFINPEAGPFGDQMKFVENDLKSAYNDANIKWIIVNGHRPYYTSAHSYPAHLDWPPQTPYFLRGAFEELFYKYNVDLYISGHIHSYERMYPIYREAITTKDFMHPLSTIYLVAGMAGSVEGHSSSVALKNYTVVYNNRQFGVTKLTVANDTHLLWQFIEAENKSVVDQVWIGKGYWTPK